MEVRGQVGLSRKPDNYETLYLDEEQAKQLLVPNDDGLPPLHFRQREHGWWLTEDTSGKFITVKNQNLPALNIWACRIRGDQHTAHAMKVGRVELVREPGNPYDPNAVSVRQLGNHCGYYNKQKARALAKLLDSGVRLEAFAVNQTQVVACDARTMAHLTRRGGPGHNVTES